jgi:hypothetical protein
MRKGKGPKGYKRSDDRIREEVNDMLLGAYELDSENIEVSVKDGEVTLTGTVSDRNDKWEAEQLASAVLGVDEVINQLRVKRSSEGESSQQGGTERTGAQGSQSSDSGRQGTGRSLGSRG